MPPVATPKAKWVIPERKPEVEARLQSELGVRPLLAAVLAQRGLDDPTTASEFLNPALSQLHDPRLLPDYDAAVREIMGAKERGDLIFIHGDYDVDGVSSTALFSRFLSKIGCSVHTHVPHREREGYGIHKAMVAEAAGLGAKLFLTCDCGISALEQVSAAREAGMRVVVTDHHTVGAELPDAQAVVNPHRKDSEYPFEELSGAGVVFKLCAGIAGELGVPVDSYYRAYLDLAALGTVADVMPLLGENRILAKYGLEQIAKSQKAGIKALIRESKLSERQNGGLKAWDISFVLGPRLNAAGRIDDAALALRLLMSTDDAEATKLARTIEDLNERRKAEQQEIVAEAVAQVIETGQQENPVIFVYAEDWHPGLIGIVAGKLAETFHRPAFVATLDPETGRLKGSARSIPGFHLAEAIRANKEFLDGGGHAMAAGFSADFGHLSSIEEALRAHGLATLTPDDFVKKYVADLEAEPEALDFLSVQELDRMEPFGEANREPLVAVREARIVEIKPTKNPEHVQVFIRFESGETVRAMAFGLGGRLQGLTGGFEADLLVQPGIDEWQGSKRLSWRIKDFAIPDRPDV